MSEQGYLGCWINRSEGTIYGSTCTLTQDHGALVVAVLAIFITFTGPQLWSIIKFILFYYRAEPDAHDGFFHQQQAVLRNNGSELDASLAFSDIFLAWRHKARSPFTRSLGLPLIALINLAAFTAAGIFSSRVTGTRSEILLSTGQCGPWSDEDRVLSNLQSLTFGILTPETLSSSVGFSSLMNTRIAQASSLSQSCYNGTVPSNDSSCLIPGRALIPWTSTTKTDACPFNSTLCEGSNQTLVLDSGIIDSLNHLGINSSPENRVGMRMNGTCTPLNVTSFVTKHQTMNVTNTGLDPTLLMNSLFLGTNTKSPNDSTFSIGRSPITAAPVDAIFGTSINTQEFALDVEFAAYPIGEGTGTFLPIEGLSQHDDVQLDLWILANSYLYLEPINDPWFSAQASVTNGSQTFYYSDQMIQALGCLWNMQYCLPSKSSEMECISVPPSVVLQSYEYLNNISSSLPPQQAAVMRRVLRAGIRALPEESLLYGTSNILLANKYTAGALSLALPDNQWQAEVNNVFAMSMLQVQLNAADFVRPLDIPLARLAPAADEEWMCSNQIVPSEAYSSFSVLGVALILSIGLAIIITSWFIEDIVRLLWKKSPKHQYRNRDWELMEMLQLQKMAFESRGLGTWAGHHGVPTTEAGQRFPAIDRTTENGPLSGDAKDSDSGDTGLADKHGTAGVKGFETGRRSSKGSPRVDQSID